MPFLTRRSVEVTPLPYDPRSPEGLAARWVQWVAAAGLDESPIDDKTGEKGSANQPSDVWFLAGCRGGQVERRIAVPGGRDLFFPVVNWWFREGKAPDMSPVLERVHGSVVVDGGVPLEPDLIVTPHPFVVAGARFNDITLRTKPRSMVAVGLWKSVPALGPGEHDLHIVGGDGFSTTLDVRYQLLVTVPGSTPWA
jgi:hypothetical protein